MVPDPTSYYTAPPANESDEERAAYAATRQAELEDRAGGADVIDQDRRALRVAETLRALVAALERNRPPVEVLLGAACRGMDTGLFFPEGKGDSQKRLQALDVCRGCPVQIQCRDWARAQRPTGRFAGIWGESESARRAATRQQSREAA